VEVNVGSAYQFVLAIVLGVALALPYVRYAYRHRQAQRVFGGGLVAAAFVYVVFAVVAGELQASFFELAGTVLFGALALLGIRFSAYFLALGWVSHVAWDLLLHPARIPTYTPRWYPAACVGFDLLVAGAILGGSWQSLRERTVA